MFNTYEECTNFNKCHIKKKIPKLDYLFQNFYNSDNILLGGLKDSSTF